MPELKMEVGQVNVPTSYKYTGGLVDVDFTNTYDNPTVIVFIATYNGGDPCDMRVTDVTSSGCTIFNDEYATGSHQAEIASYLVIESGYYTLPNGVNIAAGTVLVSGTNFHQIGEDVLLTGKYTEISFDTEFDSPPAFFTSINTFNNQLSSARTLVSAGSTEVTTRELNYTRR